MKTLFAILAIAAAGAAMAADVAWVTPSGGTITASKGDTFGDITLTYGMTTGNPTAYDSYKDSLVNIFGGNCYAGDYTLSLWLTTDQLKSSKVLFAYCANTSSSDARACNGITWNANNTITVGQGLYNQSTHSYSFYSDSNGVSNSVTSTQITLNDTDRLVNFTFSVTSSEGTMKPTLWVNGVKIGELGSYTGKMNGGGVIRLRYIPFSTLIPHTVALPSQMRL